MKKLFKNKKGFAMAELLAVSIVLLFISSILFSNYLPLVAEYENRLSYNDVTAQYAAHYIRKMYMDALIDDDWEQKQFGELKKGDIGYITVYKEGDTTKQSIFTHIFSVTNSEISWVSEKDKKQEEIREIISKYGIEEIIITRYKLDKKSDDNDDKTTYVKASYGKGSGDLYNYIHYLPNYEKSIYTEKDQDSGDQLYRIILKTKDFGYATTPILSDYKTPGSCFVGESNRNGDLTITDYNYNGDECGENVIIKKGQISINTVSGSTLTGKIVKIGDRAFSHEQSKNIKTITLSNEVTSIGNFAFEGSNLEVVPSLEKVVSVGKRAFANTRIREVDLSGSRTIGDEAFAENKNLNSVTLPSENIYSDSDKTLITTGLFAKSGNEGDGIPVEILGGMTEVGEKMFYLAKIKSIKLGQDVTTINNYAFSQYNNNSKEGKGTSNDVEIPNKVTKIGTDSFRGLNITNLKFLDGSDALSIGIASFKQNSINYLDIPSRVVAIGGSAFAESGIKSLEFKTEKLSKISQSAFFKNDITGTLSIPENVSIIADRAFEGNSNSLKINLPSTLEEIGSFAFSGTNLSDIVIPGKVSKILDYAFTNAGLNSILINDSDVDLTIGMFAFSDNKGMTKFSIPARTKSIRPYIFAGIAEGKEATIINNSTKFNADSRFWCDKFTTDISNCNCSQNGDNEFKITYVLEGITSTRYVNMGGATNE